jgi:hypothetical protein
MPRRVAKWVLRLVSGVVSIGLLLVGTVAVLASTPFGMEQARRIGLGFLRDNINGKVDIDRISGDGLLRGMVLHGVTITDSAGQHFARLDSTRLRYAFFEMLFSGLRRVVIGPVTLYGADVRVVQMPGDSVFNVERIFDRPDDGGSGGPSRLVRFDHVKIENGRAEIVRLYDGQRAAGVDERFVIEDTEAGRIQVMRFELDGEVASFVATDPGRDTRDLTIDHLDVRALVLREPVALHDIRGSVTIGDSVIGIDVSRVEVAGGRASVDGRILRRDQGTGYDLRIEGDDIALAELHRVESRAPASGSAKFVLRLESQDNGAVLITLPDLAVHAPGTNVAGSFGWLSGSRSALRDVDLRIGTLDLAWLEQVLARELPIEGRLAGRVRANGPLTAVRTNGDLRLTDWGGATEPSVRWTGTVRADRTFAASELNTEIEELDLELFDLLRPGSGFKGVVTGRVDIDGRLDESLQLRAVVRHRLGSLTSQLDGGGRIARSDDVLSMDLAFEAQPFYLQVLGSMVTALDSLHGPVRGQLGVRGWADHLNVSADVATPAGPLVLQATIDRRGQLPAYQANAEMRGFEPRRIGLLDLDARVSGELDLELRGTALEDMTGPLRATVDSATILGYPVERARIVTALANGHAVVDSATFRAIGVRGNATGGFGLIEARADTLNIVVESESFEPLERLIFGQDADPTSPRVTGTGRADLALHGSIERMGIDADAVLDHFRVDRQSAAAARVAFHADGMRTDSMRFEVRLDADSVSALDGVADSVRARYTRDAGQGTLAARAWEDGESTVLVDATYRMTGAATAWNLGDLRFRSGTGNWRLADTTAIELGPGSLRVDQLRLLPDQGGELAATGRLAWYDSAATAANTRVNFDIALRDIPADLIPPALRPTGRVAGMLGGDIHIDSTAAAPVIDAQLEATGLEYESARLERVSITANYRDRLLDAHARAFLDGVQVMTGEGALPIDLRFGPVPQRVLPEPVNMSVRMTSFPAAFVLGLLPGFRDIQGTFPEAALEATGLARDPALRGGLTLSGGAVTVEATGVRYERVEGTVLMNEDLRAIVDFSGATVNPRNNERSGTLRLTGTVDLTEVTDPGLDLEFDANSILAALRRDMEITASADVQIQGRYRRPRVTGNVSVERGTIYLDELYRQYLIVQFDDRLLFDLVDTADVSALPERTNPFIQNLVVEDLEATATSGLWLRSREMNVELAGSINVDLDRQIERIVITGSLEVIRGTYTLESGLLARNFQVQEGTVSFPGTPGIDPVFQITALHTARAGQEPLDIYADVTGSLSAPRVTLRSDIQPPISESDLASYLFFGAPTSQFGFASSSSLTGLLGGTVAGSALGYVASGLQTIGQSSGLVDYVGLTTAEAAPGAGSWGNFLTGTRIELGRYITPRLFLLITQPLDSPAGADDPGIRLEWRFSRTFRAEIFTDNRFARAPSIGLSQAIAARRVFGVFLFREWSY